MCTCVRVRSGRPSSSNNSPSPGVTSADASPLSPAGRCLCDCLSGRRTHTQRAPGSSFSACLPGFCFVGVSPNAPFSSRASSPNSSTASSSFFFLNPEPERRRRAKEEEWGEHDLRGGRNREQATVRLHIRRFLSLRLPNLALFRLPGSRGHLAHFTARRRVGLVSSSVSARGGGAPFFCRVSSPRNAAAAGWLAKSETPSFLSTVAGTRTESSSLFRLFFFY